LYTKLAGQFAKFLGKSPTSEPLALAERCCFGALQTSFENPQKCLLSSFF